MSLTTCPPEILNSIIDFLKEPDEEGWNDFEEDLLNLGLVSREFASLFRPLLYESICLPSPSWDSFTGGARELLRLIDRDPGLATCIRDLHYDELEPTYGSSKRKYSPEQLQHDHRIWSQFYAELAQKSSIQNNFDYSSAPSDM
jgi:hypothetical protein